jgi:hypothetical protein
MCHDGIDQPSCAGFPQNLHEPCALSTLSLHVNALLLKQAGGFTKRPVDSFILASYKRGILEK